MAPKKGQYKVFPIAYVEDTVRIAALNGGRWMETYNTLRDKYPEVTPPSVNTIKTWCNKYEKLGERKSLSHIRNNPSEMWAEVELTALAQLIDDIREGKFAARDLSILAGISADKRLKEQELTKGKTTNIRIHQLIEDKRKELEAEYRVVEEEKQLLVQRNVTTD